MVCDRFAGPLRFIKILFKPFTAGRKTFDAVMLATERLVIVLSAAVRCITTISKTFPAKAAMQLTNTVLSHVA